MTTVNTESSRPIKILLVDDNQEFLDSAERYLATEPAFSVVGKTVSGDLGVELARDLSPDVVLMDLMMPGMNGIDATRIIKKVENPPLVVVLTLYDVEVYRSLARAAGADAFITKDNMGTEILSFMRSAHGDKKNG